MGPCGLPRFYCIRPTHSGAAPVDNLLDVGFVRRHFGLLQGRDVGADPRHKGELGALAELVARLQAHKAVHAVIVWEARRCKGMGKGSLPSERGARSLAGEEEARAVQHTPEVGQELVVLGALGRQLDRFVVVLEDGPGDVAWEWELEGRVSACACGAVVAIEQSQQGE